MGRGNIAALVSLGAVALASPASALQPATAPPPSQPTTAPVSQPASAPTVTTTPSPSTAPELPPAQAPEERDEGRDLVAAYNVGFHWGISPGVFVSGSSVGFMITGDFRYGFDTGTVIIAPGLRVAGIFPTGAKAVLGYAITRFTIPISRFAPFVEGGAGPGYLGSDGLNASHTGLAVYGGGGAMYYFSEHFGLGVGAGYEKLLGSALSFFSVGPILHLAF